MTKREIYIYSIIFILASTFALGIVFAALTGKTLLAAPSLVMPKATNIKLTTRCSNKPAVPNLETASDPDLQKLAQYQIACQGQATDRLMLFTDMPKDDVIARQNAQAMASRLQEFSRYGIKPIVIVEPVTEWGLIDFQEYKSGFYDTWLTTYFQELKAQGITDEQMGTWAPFPEANLPYWNHQNAKPENFAAIVNKYLTILKQSFPSAKASILLNSATYENDDFNWQNGEYISLRPYVKDIKKGLVTSFGIQGFPWTPPATTPGNGIFDASEYLNYRLAGEAADILGVKEIWFNTGSFQTKYTLDPEKKVTITPQKRKDILTSIIAEAIKLRDKGYTVSINLFAQDKSQTSEATNWSYWQSGAVASSPNTPIFANFVSRLAQERIGFSLFDQAQ